MINALAGQGFKRNYPNVYKVISIQFGKFKSCGLNPDSFTIEIRKRNKGKIQVKQKTFEELMKEQGVPEEEIQAFLNHINLPIKRNQKKALRRQKKLDEARERDEKERVKGEKRIRTVMTAIHEKYDPIDISPVKGDEFTVAKNGRKYHILCHVHFVRTRSGWIRRLEALDPECFTIKFNVPDLPDEVKEIWTEESKQRLYRLLTGKSYQINNNLREEFYKRRVGCVSGKFVDSTHLELERTNGAVLKLTDNNSFILDRDVSGPFYQEEFKKKFELLNTGINLKYFSSSVPLMDAKTTTLKYWQPKEDSIEHTITIPEYDEDPVKWSQGILDGFLYLLDMREKIDRIRAKKHKEERRKICLQHETDTLEFAICSIMKPDRGLSKGTICGALRGTKTHDEGRFRHNEFCGKFNMFSENEIEDALYDLTCDGILDAHKYKNDYYQWCISYYFKEKYFDFTPLDEKKGEEGDLLIYRKIRWLKGQEKVAITDILALLNDVVEYPGVYCMKTKEIHDIMKNAENISALKKLISMKKKTVETGTKARKIYIGIEKALRESKPKKQVIQQQQIMFEY